jgi:predicted permease
MNSLLQDLRYCLRMLARTPVFTLTAIAVLALGIGANTAIFSLVDELLWSPRPFERPDEIVQLYSQDKLSPRDFRLFSYPAYRDIAAQDTVFSGVLAHNLAMVGVGEGESSRRTMSSVVSSNYFSVLGVRLVRGRAFTAAEEKPSSNAQVVIASYAYWKRTGFDPALLGTTIRINERPFTVVGITPERFSGPMMLFGPELYFPLGAYDLISNDLFKVSATRTLERRDGHALFLIARLKPGVSLAAAQPALQTIAANLERAFPVEQKNQTFLAGPVPRLSLSVSPNSRKSLDVLATLLLAVSATVLLIACLNLANLLLARGHARRKEIAIRLALGGGGRRLVRQLLTEGAVLAVIGGAVGLLLATWGTGLLVASIGRRLPVAVYFHGATNPAIFGATLGFCALAMLLFALGPALRLIRASSIDDLKANAGDDAPSRRRRRWMPRHPLVVAQLALSIALLIAAGLFVRGAINADHVDTGFNVEHALVAEVDASLAGYDKPQALQAYRAINDRIAALPGVRASAVSSLVPFGMTSITRDVRRAGIVVAPGEHPATAAQGRGFTARWNSVGADYFAAAGLPLIRGRAFTPAECDAAGAPPVAIIDATLARELFPDSDPVGQRIQFGPGVLPSESNASDATRQRQAAGMEIVGIAAPTRWRLFDDVDTGGVFVPFAQDFQANAFFQVATAAASADAAAAMVESVRGAIRAVAPAVPLFSVRTFSQHLETSVDLWMVRTGATLFGLFGGAALLLATIGIYGVKSYAVSRRTREIGIRVALGAEPSRVRWMILREGLITTAAGLATGFLLGLALARACAGMLYNVSAHDPVTLAAAPLILAAAAIAACWLPARRATRVSPMTALRTE